MVLAFRLIEVAEKAVDELVLESTAYRDEEAVRLKDDADEKRAVQGECSFLSNGSCYSTDEIQIH